MSRLTPGLCWTLILAGASSVAMAADGPRLTMKPRDGDPSRIVVEAAGLDAEALRRIVMNQMTPERWRAFLVVRVVRDGEGTQIAPALLGTYHLSGDVLRFDPRFPIEPGLRYRATFDPSGQSRSRMTAELSIDRSSSGPAARVSAVYPTPDVLPENLLRFYLHFTAPMSRGAAYRHIRLLDASGHPIADPFLELEEELWSPDGRRFTLLIDPGRIKRGLKPREEVGPVLQSGRSYVLAIDPGWPDAEGRPLASGLRKAFRAGPPDETSPDPKTWKIQPPEAGRRDALEVRFPDPLDQALLGRLIAVRDASDRPVAGSIEIGSGETTWRFRPEKPWQAGSYRLVVGTELEDVAGNSVARPFEVDEVGPITRRIVGDTVAIGFRIESGPSRARSED